MDKTGFEGLPIDEFKIMDKLSIERFRISIELMMENAGLQLARLASSFLPDKEKNILAGIGTGNNGGGGLVAARRLAGWGYKVFLDIPDTRLKPLAAIQYKRALAFGALNKPIEQPYLFLDAYLGFSQGLPLSIEYNRAVDKANHLECLKISLDLPTGFNRITGSSLFRPDMILTLAAMKNELSNYLDNTSIYIADIGIPSELYTEFGIRQPDFNPSGIFRVYQQNQA